MSSFPRSASHCVIALCLTAIISGAAIAQEPARLISPTNQILPAKTQDGIARAAAARINLNLLNLARVGSPSTLSMQLFDDLTVSAQFDRFEMIDADGFIVHGSLVDHPFSSIIMVVHPDAISAAINAPPMGVIDITGPPNGTLLVRQHSTKAGPHQTCANIPPPAQPNATPGVSPCPYSISTLEGYPADDGSMVDVLVYYTPDAVTGAGGLSQLSANIDLAFSMANDTLMRSADNPRVRCVRKAQIAYTETGQNAVDLPRLVTPGDGYLDAVHPDRDTFGGDVVQLWVNNLDRGGVAYQLFALGSVDDGRYGFSICRQDNFSLGTPAHELGHNFGCQHDRPNAAGSGFFYYSYGYSEPGNLWHTIMAYQFGTAILYYSNPNINYSGPLGDPGPTGNASTDPNVASNNALTINQTAWTVANFRPSTITSTPAARLFVRPAAPAGGDGSSWATAKRDLQDAITLAVQSRGAVSEIWVTAGTYYPNRGVADPLYNRAISFRLANGISIYGGFSGTETLLSQRNIAANVTTLSGDIGTLGNNSDNSFHVVEGTDLSSTAVLDGFTITGGNANDVYPNDSGGGFHSRCGSPTIRNCRFTGNHATYGGGAATDDGGSAQFVSCTFDNNTADNYGAMDVENGATPILTSCTFTSNSAPWGGAVGSYTASPTLSQCIFTTNSATTNNGGGFMAGGTSTPVLTQCQFNGNTATNANGGGIYVYDGANAQITNSTFTNNSASVAGAIFLFNASPTITGCTFTSNSSACCGGAIAAYQNSAPSIQTSTFLTNNSNYGAAVWFAYTSPGKVTNSLFFGNVAQFGGGAIHTTDPSAPVYTNCVFSGNRSPQGIGGAALNYAGSTPSFINCSFSNNSAQFGCGGVWNDNCTATITNSIFWQNSDSGQTQSAQITNANGGSASVNYCIIQNITGSLGGTANLGTNPQFIDADGADNIVGTIDDNLQLASNSVAIDSGSNSAVPVGVTTDAAGNPRFANAPCITDTGAGTAPIVDRGAYEYQPLAQVLGDFDNNAVVNLADISGFVAVLIGIDAAPAHLAAADMNCDGLSNGRDIAPFIQKLLGH